MSNRYTSVKIGELFDKYLSLGFPIITRDDYELIDVSKENIRIRSDGNLFVKILFLSRHKSTKHLVKITLTNAQFIITTTDHVLLRYNKNHMFETVASKDLNIYDYVKIIDKVSNKEMFGVVYEIVDMGETDEYVYDIEVDDCNHLFYANDILIHNSQFLNIQCITQWFRKKYNLPEKINDWTDEYKLKLWDYAEKFVNDKVTPYVQNLLKEKCGCEDTSMLRYSLEYIADCGVYQAKKNYAVHKILEEGPELVDKNKYTGIELKKNTMSAKTKEFLAEIYENTLHLNWNEKDFRNYIYQCYDDYMKLSIDEISQWKGYNTPKKSTGFLTFEKGASGISKACGVYNDLLQHYGIADKYDTISVGDKVQFVYVKTPNKFNIDAVAYKGRFPKEFEKDLKADYAKMFEKSIMSPLKNFMTAMNYQQIEPNQKTLFDVFDF